MKIKSTIKLVRALVAAVITFGSLAEGAVIFQRNGNNLTMKITEIITFTSTTTYSGNSVMGVTLVDAYSSDQIRHVAEATPVVVPIDGINNAGTQFFQGELLGEITRTDFNFSMYTYFSLSITITPGELIVVPVGTFTAKDYFLNSDATLPDQEIKSAFFWTSGGTRASASVAVPEPSSSLLIVLGAFGAIGLRRNR